MYIVSILNSITGQWRTTVETSLSACVQLTLGLSTEWIVREEGAWFRVVGMTASDIVKGTGRNVYPKTTKRYKHALRSLVSRWMRRYQKRGPIKTTFQIDDYRFLLRLKDATLWETVKIIRNHTRVFGNEVPSHFPLR